MATPERGFPSPSAPPIENEAYPGSRYHVQRFQDTQTGRGVLYPDLHSGVTAPAWENDGAPLAAYSTTAKDDSDSDELFVPTPPPSPRPETHGTGKTAEQECSAEPLCWVKPQPHKMPSMTNDADYIKRRGNRVKIRQTAKGMTYCLQHDDDDDDDDNQGKDDHDKGCADDEDGQYYYRVQPNLGQRIRGSVASMAKTVNRALFVPKQRSRVDVVACADNGSGLQGDFSGSANLLPGETAVCLLDLGRDLGCTTLHQALAEKKNLADLRKCSIDPARWEREHVSVSEMQRHGLTLYDVHETLGVQWGRLVNLGLRADKMTRENKWYDPYVLANCVAREEADLIHDTGFSVADIYRLRCSDLEMTQMGFDFDALLRMGLTVQEFLGLPWYLQTMADVLHLGKNHLTQQLRLQPADYAFLAARRKWTATGMKEFLGFSDADLLAIGIADNGGGGGGGNEPSSGTIIVTDKPARFTIGAPGIPVQLDSLEEQTSGANGQGIAKLGPAGAKFTIVARRRATPKTGTTTPAGKSPHLYTALDNDGRDDDGGDDDDDDDDETLLSLQVPEWSGTPEKPRQRRRADKIRFI